MYLIYLCQWHLPFLHSKNQDPYHNRGRDQMRKKGVRNSSACDRNHQCLSFFINKTILGKKLCVGTCLKWLTVATPLITLPYMWITLWVFTSITEEIVSALSASLFWLSIYNLGDVYSLFFHARPPSLSSYTQNVVFKMFTPKRTGLNISIKYQNKCNFQLLFVCYGYFQ